MRREPLFLRGDIWWCRVRNHAGKIKRQSTHCRDLEAARKAWRDLERLAADPTYAAASKAFLSDAVTEYVKELQRRGSSPATLEIAAQKSGHFLRLWGEDFPLSRIDAAKVLAYIDTREAEGAKPLTVKKELGALKGTLDVARHLGRFHVEVHRVMPLRYSGKHKPKSRAPSTTELAQLLSELPPRRAAHLGFMAATGARLSETYAARRSDVGENEVRIRGTKTSAAAGSVPVTKLTRPLLEWVMANAPGKDLLFHPWGKLHRDVEAACVRAGIEKVTPNDLRRAFATWHRLAGIEPSAIAVLLRHTTDKLAQTTYARIGGADLGAVIDAQLQGVPELCLTTGTNQENGEGSDDESSEESAPPARIELAANGLGKRYLFARSTGTKKGLERLRVGASVPILQSDNPAENGGSTSPKEPPAGGCVRCLPGCPCAAEPARFLVRAGRILPLNAPARARLGAA